MPYVIVVTVVFVAVVFDLVIVAAAAVKVGTKLFHLTLGVLS